jgi:hypothetical protein
MPPAVQRRSVPGITGAGADGAGPSRQIESLLEGIRARLGRRDVVPTKVLRLRLEGHSSDFMVL